MKKIRIFPKFLIGILFWATYFLPIYSFEKAFRLDLLENNVFEIYLDGGGVWLFSLIAIILTPLFLWLLPKFFHQFWYKIVVFISYLVFYYFACISIAWEHRFLFGNTWFHSEIFPELVKPHWYFYVFGGLGVFFHYQYQCSLQEKLKNE